VKPLFGTFLLAASASVAFAQSPDHSRPLVAAEPQDCPADRTANPNYAFEKGRLIRRGWTCQERLNPRS
jgi:hypothetical protein